MPTLFKITVMTSVIPACIVTKHHVTAAPGIPLAVGEILALQMEVNLVVTSQLPKKTFHMTKSAHKG